MAYMSFIWDKIKGDKKLKLKEAYEKYKHPGKPLSDEKLLGNFKAKMLYDLWQAIKNTVIKKA